MNLKRYIAIRIILVAFICLGLASSYVLFQVHREFGQQAEAAAETIAKQLRLELTKITAGYGSFDRFPLWDAVIDFALSEGFCSKYIATSGRIARISCKGWNKTQADKPPTAFAGLYFFIFGDELIATREIALRDRVYGSVVISSDPSFQVMRAWRDLSRLFGLTMGIVIVLCALFYLVMLRTLRPTDDILCGLERLEQGNLSSRMPRFRLAEYDRISMVFNRLVASLEQSIAERQALASQLVRVQEEERRSLARELHDEFGQCLAAINARAAAVRYSGALECKQVVAEGEAIARIVERMMTLLRSMLQRIRPPDLEELGLIESLRKLLNDWNCCGNGAIRLEFQTQGAFDDLSDTVNISIFRLVQEGLTNIAKHADASWACVKLVRKVAPATDKKPEGSTLLVIEDNGQAGKTVLPSLSDCGSTGFGLIGMRERVKALGGDFTLHARAGKGLAVVAMIPDMAASR